MGYECLYCVDLCRRRSGSYPRPAWSATRGVQPLMPSRTMGVAAIRYHLPILEWCLRRRWSGAMTGICKFSFPFGPVCAQEPAGSTWEGHDMEKLANDGC